jgi:hypothetical protein
MDTATLSSQILSPPHVLDAAPVPLSPQIEGRVLRVGDQETEFPFLVIDSPEKWAEATQVKAIYQMPIIGSGKSIAFPMIGPSLEKWESIEAKFVVPEWQDEGDPTDDFLNNRKKILAERRIAILECCLNKQFPGETAEQKIAYLNDRCPGEVEALIQFIENSLCNWSDGPQSTLLTEYSQVAQRAMGGAVIEFNSFDDWKKANEAEYFFRMQRPTDAYIIEIPLKGLSRDQKEHIQTETKESVPPLRPVFGHDRRPDKTKTVPNYQDPAWLKRTRTLMQKRTVMYFDACMPFTIPGNNVQEKYQWIAQRLVGDITKVKDFIETEFMSFGSRYSFFTRS